MRTPARALCLSQKKGSARALRHTDSVTCDCDTGESWYVRNLAPEVVTGDDLSEHFAAVGPVKRAFLAYPNVVDRH